MSSHDEVAHAWAHRTGRQTRGYAMFYDGPTIYSHGRHFAIARHAEAADGLPVVLFTTEGYSVSTSQHKGITRRAASHLRIFEVPNVMAASEVAHAANREAFITLAIDSVKRSARARTRAASLLEQANRAIADANAYAAAFGIAAEPVTFDALGDLAAEAERRAAEQQAAEALARRQREAAERLSMRDRVRAWMRGEAVRVRTSTPMVRVVGDSIETTWGATAPLADALAAYRIAQQCRRSGRAVQVGGPRVAHWGAASIDAKGTITVGCHRIPFRFAQLAACIAGLEKADAVEAAR